MHQVVSDVFFHVVQLYEARPADILTGTWEGGGDSANKTNDKTGDEAHDDGTFHYGRQQPQVLLGTTGSCLL